ncbi:MAG: N-acetylmuramoyl-L-alanine amidase [Candidatus Spyradenecus sp.]
MAVKIVLDAGHGGKDPGACSGKYHEADAALAIAKQVGTRLKAKGYEVRYTRTKDVAFSLSERCRMANNWDADYFVSIHLNASENPKAHGVEVLRYPIVGSATKELANSIQAALVDATGFYDRGVKLRGDLYVLKHTRCPAALVECGFLTNADERKQLVSAAGQKRIAEAIAKGIDKAAR